MKKFINYIQRLLTPTEASHEEIINHIASNKIQHEHLEKSSFIQYLNCRNCGSNEHKNSKCSYCGTHLNSSMRSIKSQKVTMNYGYGNEPVSISFGKDENVYKNIN